MARRVETETRSHMRMMWPHVDGVRLVMRRRVRHSRCDGALLGASRTTSKVARSYGLEDGADARR